MCERKTTRRDFELTRLDGHPKETAVEKRQMTGTHGLNLFGCLNRPFVRRNGSDENEQQMLYEETPHVIGFMFNMSASVYVPMYPPALFEPEGCELYEQISTWPVDICMCIKI